ncbi:MULTISPECIES: hypothetical protein [unclassified Mesorhizobium]
MPTLIPAFSAMIIIFSGEAEYGEPQLDGFVMNKCHGASED